MKIASRLVIIGNSVKISNVYIYFFLSFNKKMKSILPKIILPSIIEVFSCFFPYKILIHKYFKKRLHKSTDFLPKTISEIRDLSIFTTRKSLLV